MPEIIKNPNSAITYYVNIEKGVVAAVIEHPALEAKSYLFNILNASESTNIILNKAISNAFAKMPTKISAKAVCAEEDEFNLDVGMKIARERALEKLYKSITNVVVDINNDMEDILETVEKVLLQTSKKYYDFSQRNKESKI